MLGKTNADSVGEADAGQHPDRRSVRREATKAEILDAAWALVRIEGLAGLSLRDLAARVGMRAPSLYQYFASKHAIYDALFGQAAYDALEYVGDFGELAKGADVRAPFRAYARRFFDFCVADPARYQLLFQRTIPGFEPSAEAYAPAVELLESMQRSFRVIGIADPGAADLWTAVLSGLVDQQLANDPGGHRWASLVEGACDMYLDYVTPTRRKK
jgi:AcrR family transcriptional regulator